MLRKFAILLLFFVTAVTSLNPSSCYHPFMMRQTLHVYIADDCWSCQETRRIVADLTDKFPDIQVNLCEMNQDKPDDVFAVPTYVLNGRVISLGNPTREELHQKLAAVQQLVNL